MSKLEEQLLSPPAPPLPNFGNAYAVLCVERKIKKEMEKEGERGGGKHTRVSKEPQPMQVKEAIINGELFSWERSSVCSVLVDASLQSATHRRAKKMAERKQEEIRDGRPSRNLFPRSFLRAYLSARLKHSGKVKYEVS